jgi:hypothetical protein
MKVSTTLNGVALIEAAGSCFREDKQLEGTFLLLAGQIRSSADLALLRPVDDADERATGELYGLLYFKAGGAGPDQLYRDSSMTRTLFGQLDEWSPSFFDGYNPGWKYKKSSRTDLYEETLRNSKAGRLAQLRHYVSLINDDVYYAASRELAEIQKRNPTGIVTNTPDGERMKQLYEVMQQASRSIRSPSVPKFEGSQRHLFEPDLDASFKQLIVGFNGPDSPGGEIFERESDARTSWLSEALPNNQLEKVLSQVDFARQILVIFTIGQRETATGTVLIRDIRYDASTQSLSVSGGVGVNERECGYGHAKSYPFAVAVAMRPAQVPKFPGYSLSNFGDGCKPPKTGNLTHHPSRPPKAATELGH